MKSNEIEIGKLYRLKKTYPPVMRAGGKFYGVINKGSIVFVYDWRSTLRSSDIGFSITRGMLNDVQEIYQIDVLINGTFGIEELTLRFLRINWLDYFERVY